MKGVTPFLWLDADVEEVAKFYVAVLPDSRLESVHRSASGRLARLDRRAGHV